MVEKNKIIRVSKVLRKLHLQLCFFEALLLTYNKTDLITHEKLGKKFHIKAQQISKQATCLFPLSYDLNKKIFYWKEKPKRWLIFLTTNLVKKNHVLCLLCCCCSYCFSWVILIDTKHGPVDLIPNLPFSSSLHPLDCFFSFLGI